MIQDLYNFLGLPAVKSVLQLAGLIFARLVPVVVLTPLFGGQLTPQRYRVGMTIVLTAALVAGFLPGGGPVVEMTTYALLLAKEAVLGLTLAVIIVFLFEAFTAAGALIDLSRGATNTQLFDPLSRQQNSVLAVFYMHLAVVLFLTVGGHVLLLTSLADSMVRVPLHEVVPRDLLERPMAAVAVRISADLFVTAVQLAAPVIVVIFTLDLSLGLLNKVAPQVQVFFLSLTIKPWLGLLFVLLTMGLVAAAMVDQFDRVVREVTAWVGRLIGG